jgi:ATP-dependent Clp protease protease subunit
MYIVDINSEEPIMLLNKQIGKTCNEDGSWDGELFIEPSDFQEELLQLDALGKKRIQVWINSVGGSVVGGMSIFNSILKSKTPVDTYNVGIAASIAGAIFMAGRKRVMADYAQFMMHPVSGGSGASTNAMSDSVVKMIEAKCGLDSKQVKNMMDCTTWMGASDCLMNGICTEIEATKESNKKNMPTATSEMYAYSNKLILENFTPTINKNQNKMSLQKVTNMLGLNEDATQENIVAEITKLSNKVTAANLEKDSYKTQAETLKAEIDATTNKLNELQSNYDAMVAEKEANETAAKETAATNFITEFVNKGCIKNDAAVVAEWVNLYKNNPEGTKTILEGMPMNKVAPAMPKPADHTNSFVEGAYLHEQLKAINKK